MSATTTQLAFSVKLETFNLWETVIVSSISCAVLYNCKRVIITLCQANIQLPIYMSVGTEGH